MAHITIKLLEDWNDCETCGGGTEYGGVVTVDGLTVYEYIPHASCFDNNYVTEADLLTYALKHLGHTVEIQ